MKELIWDAAAELAARRNRFITVRSQLEELQGLVSSLHPRALPAGLRRLGPPGDGGYLVPDDLEGLAACFSPGVSLISGFEKECAELGMQVFLADRSVDGPAESHERFRFVRKFVGVTTDENFMTLDDWVAGALPDRFSDLLLQIDIEGFEYETFLATSDALMRRFRIIVGEFHYLDQLWNKPFFRMASRAFEKILQTHVCVHIHPNNCCGSLERWGLHLPRIAEFTFLRRDRTAGKDFATAFPHPLDCDNAPGRPPLPLPGCWFGGPRRIA
jgi:hypothetical protein